MDSTRAGARSPSPGGLERVGKPRKEFDRRKKPRRGERAGASESLGWDEGGSKIWNSEFGIRNDLTPRDRRWFTQPLWRQALSVFLIVELVFTTTPTDVQAQTYDPVFYYYAGDHLGSSNIMTDRAGVVVEHYEYTAFGFAKCSTGSAFQVSNRYTGQVLDDETGLYYYNSRYYDPVLGRFIQPDTIVPYPDNPQTLNRYTYVNNNPLKEQNDFDCSWSHNQRGYFFEAGRAGQRN